MSAFTDALDALLARQLAATTDEERRQIAEERAAVILANHRGEFYAEPERELVPVDDADLPFDGRAAAAGRDE